MRRLLIATVVLLATLLGAAPAGADPSLATNIFGSLGGATTIDQGGAIHSQVRSIYSMGGGMTSFQGKRITLLAADPPSFSAGCSGISWHFGGFAFISVDEIRQLVESISQASLGVAVDLAMQTLCPQCYAVMSKLREMANLMRNAAADACKIARNFGALLKDKGVFPSTGRISDCAQVAAGKAQDVGFLGSQFGSGMCTSLQAAEDGINKMLGSDIAKFFTGQPTSDGTTPSKQQLDAVGNITYQALTALGYKDGFAKNLLLSYLGMSIIRPEPTPDCKAVFANLEGSAKKDATPPPAAPTEDAKAEAAASNGVSRLGFEGLDPVARETSPGVPQATVPGATDTGPATVADAMMKDPTTTPGGATKGKNICHAVPLLQNVKEVALKVICGTHPVGDAEFFRTKFPTAQVEGSAFALMCGKTATRKIYGTTAGIQNNADPMIYVCDSTTEACTKPKMQRLSEATNAPQGADNTASSPYTGLGWMVLDALYTGVEIVKKPNGNLEAESPLTVKILNHSDYPLYRVVNLAAVYPGLADDLLFSYGALIAIHYAMDTLSQMMSPGFAPQLSLVPVRGGNELNMTSLNQLRSDIMNMIRIDREMTNEALKRISSKQAMVGAIVQVNKALQADVISQGLGGNTNMAISLKKQLSPTGVTP